MRELSPLLQAHSVMMRHGAVLIPLTIYFAHCKGSLKEGVWVNSVSIVGKVSKVYDSTTVASTMKTACAYIGVTRPYKVDGKAKADVFQVRAVGKMAERLLLTFPSQIIGISGMLEKDDSKNIFINVRNIFFYGKSAADKINETTIPYEQIMEQSGFAGIDASEIPDF